MSDVLFVCVHNAGRSQMAKALFNRIAKERGIALRAESAGTEPAHHVHHSVVKVMREWSFDLSQVMPKTITNEMVERARRVITMGCAVDAEACPAIYIKNVEDWGLPDPADKEVEEVRAIRDLIAQRVEALIASMT